MCKYSAEIQSFHFGASRKQATIHTGVLYLKDKNPISFESMSNCLDHGPNAIWDHLNPILEKLKRENPQVQLVHFFSDGPTNKRKVFTYSLQNSLKCSKEEHGTFLNPPMGRELLSSKRASGLWKRHTHP